MRWLLAFILVGSAATAHAALPKKIIGIGARANGALVLEAESPRLVLFDATGEARDVAHPDVGNLDAIDGEWIIGRTGLLHEVGGEWQRIALPPLPEEADPSRRGRVVVIAQSRVVVTRFFEHELPRQPSVPFVPPHAGTVVDLVDVDGTVTPLVTLPQIALTRPVADGRGGFWTIVNRLGQNENGDSYAGYVHWSGTTWELFRPPPTKTSSFLEQLPPMHVNDALEDAAFEMLAATTDGGALAQVRYSSEVRGIARDGTIGRHGDIGDSSKISKVCAMLSEGNGHLVVTTGYHDTIAVSVLDEAARVVSRTELPLPAWHQKAHFRPPVYHCEASLARGRLYIASGPFLFERVANGFTAHYGPAVPGEVEVDNQRNNPSLATVAVPTLFAFGLGTGVGGFLDDEHRYGAAALETFAGAAGGFPAALFLDVLAENECTEGGDYAFFNTFACMIRQAGYVVGVVGGGSLGALGTYLVGREYDELPDKRDAVCGAMAGGSLGAALSIASTKLLLRYTNAGRRTRTAVASMLIGAGSTIGYQLAR